MSLDATGFEVFINLGESLRQLELIVGPNSRPAIAAVREGLARAAAKRQEGDPNGALQLIHQAMERIALLGSEMDSEEGAMMRFIAERFTEALKAGDKTTAKEVVNMMRYKAGDPKKDPSTDW
jgi:hypothetical protein